MLTVTVQLLQVVLFVAILKLLSPKCLFTISQYMHYLGIAGVREYVLDLQVQQECNGFE